MSSATSFPTHTLFPSQPAGSQAAAAAQDSAKEIAKAVESLFKPPSDVATPSAPWTPALPISPFSSEEMAAFRASAPAPFFARRSTEDLIVEVLRQARLRPEPSWSSPSGVALVEGQPREVV